MRWRSPRWSRTVVQRPVLGWNLPQILNKFKTPNQIQSTHAQMTETMRIHERVAPLNLLGNVGFGIWRT